MYSFTTENNKLSLYLLSRVYNSPCIYYELLLLYGSIAGKGLLFLDISKNITSALVEIKCVTVDTSTVRK